MCKHRFPGAVIALVLVLVAGATGAHARVWGAGGQVLTPSTPGVAGTPNDDEEFGARLASGDFDGDGFADVAVGALGETVGGLIHAGAVHVFYGSRTNFGVADDQRLVQGQDGVPGAPETYGQFGWALAVGDFDGNGFDDLAIGAPGVDVGAASAAGAIWVVYGGSTGLVPASAIELDEGSSGIPGAVEADDLMGDALASGDFDHDGYDDLAVGVSGEELSGCANGSHAGRVLVLSGSASGLSTSGVTSLDGGLAQPQVDCDAYLGSELAVGDFDGNGFADLAIGAPLQTVADSGSHPDAGAVYVVPGAASGLTGVGASVWTQAGPVPGSAEDFDYFGEQLAVGNFNGDAYDDLVVGIPHEDVSGVVDAGAVVLLYGNAAGLTTTGALLLSQATSGVGGAAEKDDFFGLAPAAGDFDRDGFDDLAVGTPYEDLTSGPAYNEGMVQVFAGSAAGLVAANNQSVERNRPGVAGSPQTSDNFGSAFAVGDVDGDGVVDLVVGVPGQYGSPTGTLGAIQLLRGALFAASFEDGDTAEWSLTSP